MAFYILNIGSNLGNRRLNLSKALAAIAREFGEFELSHVVESDPWGFDSTNAFLNVGLAFSSDLGPEEVMKKLMEIEHAISPAPHRTPDGVYADRVIDIDIVAADRLVIDSASLTLPHPRLAERDFFLRPLEEIAPGWTHPLTGLNATEMLAALRREEKD